MAQNVVTTSAAKIQRPQASTKMPNLSRAACGMTTGNGNRAGAVRITSAAPSSNGSTNTNPSSSSKASSTSASQARSTSAAIATPKNGPARGQSMRARAPFRNSSKAVAFNRVKNSTINSNPSKSLSSHQPSPKHSGHTMPSFSKAKVVKSTSLEDQNMRRPISLPMITDLKPQQSSSEPSPQASMSVKPISKSPSSFTSPSLKKAAKGTVSASENNSRVGGSSISAFGGHRQALFSSASGFATQNLKEVDTKKATEKKAHAHHHHEDEKTLGTLRKFSNAMGNFSMLEVVTGLAATLATNFHSGWLAWTLDSVIETLHNSINSHKEIPWYVPKFLIKIVESISNKGVSFHHHTHDIEGHEHDEGCMSNYTREMQEKLISFLTLVGSSLTFVFSLVKPSLFKKSLAEKVKESSTTVSSLVGKTKPFFETLLPLLNSGVMLSSGLVKSKLGNHADHAGAQNSSREDYYCGIGSLLLAIEPYLAKMNSPLGRVSEMALGAVISALSIMNAIKGLGYNMTVKNVFNIIRTGDIKHLFKGALQGEQKYPLNFFEKSSFANAGYGMMRKIMSWFKIELPAADTLKTSQNTTKNA